jgi:hypothetical protein
MSKKLILSTALITILSTSFTGCATNGLGTPKVHKMKDVSKVQIFQLKIAVEGIHDLNKKLKYLSHAHKLSILLHNTVFANEDIEKLMTSNAKKIEELEKSLKNKTEEQKEKELIAFLDKLEASPQFKLAKKEVKKRYDKVQKELVHVGVDIITDFLINKLTKKTTQSVSNMNGNIFIEMLKVPLILEQIASTTENVALVTQKGVIETYKSGEDLTMYISNSLQNSLTEDLSEAKAVDKKA